MKTREEVARFIEHQFNAYSPYVCKLQKMSHYHYGKQDLRDLLDFIYEGFPASTLECVNKDESLT